MKAYEKIQKKINNASEEIIKTENIKIPEWVERSNEDGTLSEAMDILDLSNIDRPLIAKFNGQYIMVDGIRKINGKNKTKWKCDVFKAENKGEIKLIRAMKNVNRKKLSNSEKIKRMKEMDSMGITDIDEIGTLLGVNSEKTKRNWYNIKKYGDDDIHEDLIENNSSVDMLREITYHTMNSDRLDDETKEKVFRACNTLSKNIKEGKTTTRIAIDGIRKKRISKKLEKFVNLLQKDVEKGKYKWEELVEFLYQSETNTQVFPLWQQHPEKIDLLMKFIDEYEPNWVLLAWAEGDFSIVKGDKWKKVKTLPVRIAEKIGKENLQTVGALEDIKHKGLLSKGINNIQEKFGTWFISDDAREYFDNLDGEGIVILETDGGMKHLSKVHLKEIKNRAPMNRTFFMLSDWWKNERYHRDMRNVETTAHWGILNEIENFNEFKDMMEDSLEYPVYDLWVDKNRPQPFHCLCIDFINRESEKPLKIINRRKQTSIYDYNNGSVA
ncbi:MAG: hypothetical protein ABEK17_04755 [Candidatus Aenigmatarchaeota archaeon]